MDELIENLNRWLQANRDDNWDRYRVIAEHFKEMEQRYHTWMNYYSLFNGALLVAYCTILVSTGKIVEMGGEKVQDDVSLASTVYWMNCTYWYVLFVIACLGGVAAYCWYLSAIGHQAWLNNWRRHLHNMRKDFDCELAGIGESQTCFLLCRGRSLLHFHSTYRITKFFICCVLFVWIYMAIYSYFDVVHDKHQCIPCSMFLAFSITLILIVLERILHVFFGSDVSQMVTPDEDTASSFSSEVKKMFSNISPWCSMFIIIPAIVVGPYCFSCIHNTEEKNRELISMQIECFEK